MDTILVLEQTLNGIQLGVMLFLMAAGLTLIFGIMNFINLTHGALYMVGAFTAISGYSYTGSFVLALILGVLGGVAVGVAIELIAARRLYSRNHLDQVLGTFGLMLFFNEAVQMIWGRPALFLPTPDLLSGAIEILPDVFYPAYRLAITVAGLLIGVLLHVMIGHTRIGMLIRAGSSNREMTGALGVNISLLFTFIFALGAAFAAAAGVLTAPIGTVDATIGDRILLITFVVIVIGGIGSIRGAFVGALLVGVVETFGRFLLTKWLGPSIGPAAAAMAIYILMAAILIWRPTGLLPARV
jgi:branched-chain amino acid transport system permease protein